MTSEKRGGEWVAGWGRTVCSRHDGVESKQNNSMLLEWSWLSFWYQLCMCLSLQRIME